MAAINARRLKDRGAFCECPSKTEAGELKSFRRSFPDEALTQGVSSGQVISG
jgi:hypothetical protein